MKRTVLSLATVRMYLKQRVASRQTSVWELAIGGAWLCWGDSESLPIVARQEVPEHLVGLLDG